MQGRWPVSGTFLCLLNRFTVKAVIEGMTGKIKKTVKIDRTLSELFAGILLYGVICETVGIFFVKNKIYYTIGAWYGILLAVFMAWHMWRSLDRGLDLGEAGAPKYFARANSIRYFVVAAAYIILAILDFGSPIAAFFTILSLKAAAYLQPLTHKCFKKLFGWEDVFPPGIPDEEVVNKTDAS